MGFPLPLFFGWLLALALAARFPRELASSRGDRFLAAALGTSLYLVFMTEALSAFRLLTTTGVVLGWTLGSVALLGLLAHARVTLFPASHRRVKPETEGTVGDPIRLILRTAIGLLLAGTTLLALVAVPNAWDSMTYHLPRVAHWLQNRSIGIYATSCLYQNQHSPLAEWMQLHLALLQGNDRLGSFVQWTAYAGSIVAVARLTEACGGSRRAALLAAFFAATLPIAVLQASTTENDDVAGFFLLCTALGCVRAAAEPSFFRIAFTGVALGLALLTKAVAYLYAPPFLAWLAIAWLWRNPRRAVLRLAAVALLALAINSGYYARNVTTSGTWLGNSRDSGPGYNYVNELHTPGALCSNLLRNLSLQTFQFPGTVDVTRRAVAGLHHRLGLDPADPRITSYAPYYYIPNGWLGDECANPLHLLAFVLGAGLLVVGRARHGLAPRLLALCVIAGALIFCLVLKWQPFNSRLHLPLLLLGLPVAAIALASYHRLLPLLFAALMLSMTLPLIIQSYSQPLFGERSIFTAPRNTQRFLLREDARADYERTVHYFHAAGVRRVGLIGPPDNSGWEYPLWAPDEARFGYTWRIDGVNVTSVYAPLEDPTAPDAVVDLRPGGDATVMVHGHLFQRVLTSATFSVYGK